MNHPPHSLSLDVEDFSNGAVLFSAHRTLPPRPDVIHLTRRMLDIFERNGSRATCFCLGEVAATFPDLIREIAARGHRLGVHGWHHHRIHELEPQEFFTGIDRARKLLQDLSGQAVDGYRAVAMSLTQRTWWAYEEIARAGFCFSSSIYPFNGPRYGVANAPMGPHYVTTAYGSRILEIPLTVVPVGNWRLPAIGGGYLRHFPYAYSNWAMHRLERSGRQAVCYLHPYELDTDASLQNFPFELAPNEMRRLQKDFGSQFRNRQYTESKLDRLLSNWNFAPLEEAFSEPLSNVYL